MSPLPMYPLLLQYCWTSKCLLCNKRSFTKCGCLPVELDRLEPCCFFFFRGRLACAPCMCTLASFFKQDCILLGTVASKKSSAYHGSLADALVFTQTLACIKYYLGRTNIMCHGTPFPVFFQTQWGHCVCFFARGSSLLWKQSSSCPLGQLSLQATTFLAPSIP